MLNKKMNTESRLNLTVFILACVHWAVSLLNCVKKFDIENLLKLPKNVLNAVVDFRNWNKHTWCISLLVMTTIVVLTGLNQWMYFDDDDDEDN